MSLARALVAELVDVKLDRMRRLVLTARSGDRGRIVAALASLRDQVNARWRGRVGLLTVLDVSQRRRSHGNVLVLVPPDLDARTVAENIVTSWRRLAPDGGARSAQCNRGVRNRPDLEHRVFGHDLAAAGRVAGSLRERVALVGPLAERVGAVGPLERIWRTVASSLGVDDVTAPEVESVAPRERRAPLRSGRPGPGGRCAWCLDRIPSDARVDRRWCYDDCQRTASNALVREAKRLGLWVKAFVADRERDGWSRPEALRAARAVSHGEHRDPTDIALLGAPFVDAKLKRDTFARCADPDCGAVLGVDVSAVTCGARCRTRRARARSREELLDAVQSSGHPAAPVVHRLSRMGHGGIAIRVARLIVERKTRPRDALAARQAKLVNQLSLTPRSFDELCARAHVLMTSADRAETIAAWLIGGAVEASGRRGGELRLRLCPWSHGAGLDGSICDYVVETATGV